MRLREKILTCGTPPRHEASSYAMQKDAEQNEIMQAMSMKGSQDENKYKKENEKGERRNSETWGLQRQAPMMILLFWTWKRGSTRARSKNKVL